MCDEDPPSAEKSFRSAYKYGSGISDIKEGFKSIIQDIFTDILNSKKQIYENIKAEEMSMFLQTWMIILLMMIDMII